MYLKINLRLCGAYIGLETTEPIGPPNVVQ